MSCNNDCNIKGCNNNSYDNNCNFDYYINNLIKDRSDMSVFLVNGIRLDGKIVAYDVITKYLWLCNSTNKLQVILLHAVSTISFSKFPKENNEQQCYEIPENFNTYVNNLIQQCIDMSIYLINGIRLDGKISGYDNKSQCIWLCNSINKNKPQVIFLNAVSTISFIKPKNEDKAAEHVPEY